MASDNQSKWTLYVPKGSKAAYQANQYWRGFKSIVEDASLVSGNGEPGNGGESEDKPSSPKYDYRNLTYYIDGVAYKMILVDGGPLPPFYIMQTELPTDKPFMIENEYIGILDNNLDNTVIRSEFKSFLDNLRALTGIEFRLPTTSEWLYAAKGGKKNKGYIYSGSDNIDEVAWYKNNSGHMLQDIAKKKPNELGLYDMSGNYAEISNDNDNVYDIDGNLCGGNWSEEEKFCKSNYVKPQPASGKIPGTNFKNAHAFNARYETVRFVYSIPK